MVKATETHTMKQRITEHFRNNALKYLAIAFVVIWLIVIAFPKKDDLGWPKKPLTMVVGSTAGGGADTYARILSARMHDEIGIPVAVFNKTGAASMIALDYVAKQEPDGYTILLQVVGAAVAKEILGDSPVNFRKNMRPIAILGLLPAILAIPIDSPFEDAKSFFDYARNNPGKLRWASPGRGGILHVAAEMAFENIDVEMKDVPFKGGLETKTAVVAGQVDVGMMSLQHYKGFESKMRVLGLFSDERDLRQPEILTFKEQGLDIPTIISPFGVYVRSETSNEIVLKIQNAVRLVTETEDYKRLINKAGLNNNYYNEKEARELVDQMYITLSR
jgi:tripartite-type tricarboxylate transporter receptor subunit TctC